MHKKLIVFIVRLRDNSLIWNSEPIDYFSQDSESIYCWHHAYNFLKDMDSKDRDSLGFYTKSRVFEGDNPDNFISESKFYYIRKMSAISEEEYQKLENEVGHEILPWNDDYIPHVLEEIE